MLRMSLASNNPRRLIYWETKKKRNEKLLKCLENWHSIEALKLKFEIKIFLKFNLISSFGHTLLAKGSLRVDLNYVGSTYLVAWELSGSYLFLYFYLFI